MGHSTRLKNIYQNEGLITAVNKVVQYILINSFISVYIKSALGQTLHQKIYAFLRLGYWPQIRNPRSFNEKIINRKLFTDNDQFSLVEDKFRSRNFVKERISKELSQKILPELYHVTDDPETILFNDLPSEYVVKPTHLTGGQNVIIGPETKPDPELIKSKCKMWLNTDYGDVKGEYWYKQISPKIIIEEYIHSEKSRAPTDYKFMVFHGEVKCIHATYNRFDGAQTKRNFYDKDWNSIDVELFFPQGDGVTKPSNLDKMIEIAEKLGDGFEHIRVDLYSPEQEDEIYFGEITVAESSGVNPFIPREYDFKLGSYW